MKIKSILLHWKYLIYMFITVLTFSFLLQTSVQITIIGHINFLHISVIYSTKIRGASDTVWRKSCGSYNIIFNPIFSSWFHSSCSNNNNSQSRSRYYVKKWTRKGYSCWNHERCFFEKWFCFYNHASKCHIIK